jgi:hypothetical protein
MDMPSLLHTLSFVVHALHCFMSALQPAVPHCVTSIDVPLLAQ